MSLMIYLLTAFKTESESENGIYSFPHDQRRIAQKPLLNSPTLMGFAFHAICIAMNECSIFFQRLDLQTDGLPFRDVAFNYL